MKPKEKKINHRITDNILEKLFCNCAFYRNLLFFESYLFYVENHEKKNLSLPYNMIKIIKEFYLYYGNLKKILEVFFSPEMRNSYYENYVHSYQM